MSTWVTNKAEFVVSNSPFAWSMQTQLWDPAEEETKKGRQMNRVQLRHTHTRLSTTAQTNGRGSISPLSWGLTCSNPCQVHKGGSVYAIRSSASIWYESRRQWSRKCRNKGDNSLINQSWSPRKREPLGLLTVWAAQNGFPPLSSCENRSFYNLIH